MQPDIPDEEHEQPGRRKCSDQKEEHTERQAFDHDASTRRIYLPQHNLCACSSCADSSMTVRDTRLRRAEPSSLSAPAARTRRRSALFETSN
jgi:hypothetical protein